MSIVLMYHRVTETDLDPHNLAVSPLNFKEHLAVLRKLAAPRRLMEIVDSWSDISNDVAVTFDDGYADNLFEAVPALEAEEIPATIFVTTGLLDCDGYWIDRLARCLLADQEYSDAIALKIEGEEIKIDLSTQKTRQVAHRHLHGLMRNLHPSRIETTIAQLADLLSVDPTPPPQDRPLTSQEVTQLSSHPLIDLGGHTVSHPCLARLSPSKQRWEIEACKKSLQALGAPKALAFAYPFGDRVSYTLNTRRLVRKSGWHHAVISEPRKVFWLRRYAVPRFYVGNWDGDTFEARLLKWLGSN
jgi:peptidoglycan/xylan/chitin deacetylase (PgdA/CDA1 family)